MATKSPESKGRDRAISTLSTLVQILDVAQGVCGFPPAQIAIGSTSALLAVIRVRFPLLSHCECPVHGYSGYHGQ